MSPKRYSREESLRRLVLLLQGNQLADDTPGIYAGESPWDWSLSDLVELMQGSYPGVTGVLPFGIDVPASSVEFDDATHIARHLLGIGAQRIGEGDNYTQFGSSGTMEFVGTATMFDDMEASLTPDKQGSNSKPDYDFTNLGLLFPQNDTDEKVHLIIQFRHKKKLDTPVYPHIHYIQGQTGTPVFEYAYRWYSNGQHMPSVWQTGTTVDGNRGIFTWTSGSMLQIASFPAVTPPMEDEGVSSNFEMILWRNDNEISGDVLAKYIDVHYEIDTVGSDGQYTK
ncbi:MAG: hypothetical protein ACXADY_18350 [Candidatus Hodarchaeales archaeon]|jgi:hypothetical protein